MDLSKASFDFAASDELLQSRSRALFGSTDEAIRTQIMVTMPEETADDMKLVKGYLMAGMNAARINLSHGDYHLWDKIIDSIVEAGNVVSQEPTIFIDLPGPKIRVDSMFKLHDDSKGYDNVEHIAMVPGESLELMKESDLLELNDFDKVNAKIITVPLPEIIDDIQVSDRIFFDDGAIEAKLTSKSSKVQY